MPGDPSREEKMKRANRILLILSSVFLLGAVASGSTLLIKRIQSQENEAVEIKSDDSVISNEMDLGIILPGEKKEQRISVTSLIDLDSTCTLSFLMEDLPKAADYLRVAMEVEGKKEEMKFADAVGKENLFAFAVPSKKTRSLTITYALAEDVAEEILETKMSFTVQLKAKTAI